MIYKYQVKNFGNVANKLRENGTLILFDSLTDDLLKEFGYLVRRTVKEDIDVEENEVIINGRPLKIVEVGNLVKDKLNKTNHTVFELQSEDLDNYQNQIVFDETEFPKIDLGSIIEIRLK